MSSPPSRTLPTCMPAMTERKPVVSGSRRIRSHHGRIDDDGVQIFHIRTHLAIKTPGLPGTFIGVLSDAFEPLSTREPYSK